jgi:hypothetical protein
MLCKIWCTIYEKQNSMVRRCFEIFRVMYSFLEKEMFKEGPYSEFYGKFLYLLE